MSYIFENNMNNNHNRNPSKWITLGWTCLTMTGVYYSMDIPAALHQPLKDYMSLSFSPMKFNLLYSVYSIPNILLPFMGGYLVDRFGGAVTSVFFASLVFVGQLLFSWGLYRKSWNLLFLARFVYGLGGECIGVATSAINSNIFHGSDLALAFGVNVAVSRLGSVLNNMASPKLAHQYGVVQAGLVGTFMNFISLVSCLMLWNRNTASTMPQNSNALEHGYGNSNAQESHVNSMTQPLLSSESSHDDDLFLSSVTSHEHATLPNIQQEETMIHVSNPPEKNDMDMSIRHQVQNFPILFWLLSASCVVIYGCVLPFNNIASGVLLERNYFTNPPVECALKYPYQCSMGTLAPFDGNDISFHAKTGSQCILPSTTRPILPMSIYVNRSDTQVDGSISWDHDVYHYTSLTSEDVDCNDSFWSNACTANFCKALESATERSTKVMSIPYVLSATLSPFFGFLVDRIGNRAILASMASIILIMVHKSLSKTYVSFIDNGTLALETASSPVLPLIGQGLAYVCYASVIWPSIPLVVSKDSVGTAFGAITAIQNIGLAIFPLIIAKVYDASDQLYIPNVEYFFVACAFCGTLIGVWINILDRKQNHVLNKVYIASNTDES